jgi:hypothetical protein
LVVWFRLYERFPEADGCGVFWSILHGIESQHGCETLVVESVRRQPSQFPLLMLNRLLNAGMRWASGVELLELLQQVAANEQCLPSVRRAAKSFLAYQRG